jgi:predicted MFS family arabinose efflux permease
MTTGQRAAAPVAWRPAGPRRGLALAVVSAANFLVLADATMVNVALPPIGRALGLTAAGLPWLASSYSFAFGGLLLAGGRAAEALGPRRAFAAGMSVFAAGSLGCALARTAVAVLACRVVQGAGGALACPAALSVIAVMFPAPAERARALAGWSAAGAAAVALGPLIGGLLAGALGWPAVFAAPLPVCAAAAAGGWRWLPGRRAGRPAATGAGGYPVRRLAAANLMLALTSAALAGACYACTLWLQELRHLGPLAAGLGLLPLSAGVVTGSALAPRLLGRAGQRPVAIAGLLLAAAADAALARSPARAPLAELLPLLAVLAIGFGAASVPVAFAATAVPGHEAQASALYQTAGQLGGGSGLFLLGALAAAAARGSIRAGAPAGAALAAGYDRIFAGGTAALALAALTAVVLLPPARAAADRHETRGRPL